MNLGPYRLIQLLGHRQNAVSSVAFSPDGAWIAGGGADSLIHIWDARSGELLRTLEGHEGAVNSIAFGPDGRWLASGSDDRTVRVWDAQMGAPLRTLEGHGGRVRSLAASPDGRWLASGSDDETVRLWDAQTGAPLRTLEGHEGRVGSLAASPDGRWLASGSGDGTVRLWDAQTGAPLRTLEGHGGGVASLAASPDGRWLASGLNDGTVRLWDARTGAPLRTLEGHGDWVMSLAAGPGGRWLASGSDDGTVRLWDAQTGAPLRILEGHGDCWVRNLAASPDGFWLANGLDDGTVRLWDALTGAPLRTLEGNGGRVASLAASSDGCWLGSGSDDGTVRLWDARTGAVLRTLEGHGGGVASLAASPDGRWLASGSDDRTVRLWDAQTGAPLHTLEGHGDWVGSLAVDPDGRWLASGSDDRTVRLWDAQTGAPLRTLKGHEGGVASLAVSPDGRWLASGSDDRTVRLWDAQTGAPMRTLKGHEGGVASLAASPDGRWLASGSYDRTVRLWDAQTGAPLRTLEGHEGGVASLAASPDGRWLASGSDDCTVHLWEAATGRLVQAYMRHPYQLSGLGFAFLCVPTAQKPFAYGTIWLRTLDETAIETAASDAESEPETITTAKIVLLGESSIGKSALALRLAENRYEDQQTTHGMRIWKLQPEQLDPTMAAPPGERRELVLWDLGGQDEYRLIHQLFIHDTELALMLFDSTRGKGELDDVLDWNARLEAQRAGRPTVKLLVGSKLDEGDGSVDRSAVDRLLADCAADAFLPTSAKAPFGIPGLCHAVAQQIDWKGLAKTTRPALFQRVRDQIDTLTSRGDVALALVDLKVLVERSDPGDYSDRAVDQVVDQLARQGAIADTRLASGERVLVLQIGEIERYAGSLILAAKDSLRTGGVPVLDESEIAQPGFAFPRIPRTDRLLPSRERVVLECVMGLLIERGICLRQPGLLIFPSLFPEGRDEHIEGADSVSLYYDFSGPIDSLYAALVAQAAAAGRFGRVRLSPGRVELEAPDRGLCGLRLKSNRSGRGHLDIFFAGPVPGERRRLFRAFVESFLRENGVGVTEAVEVRCADCGHWFAESDVRGRIDEDAERIFCPKGHPTVFVDALVRTRETGQEVDRALVALKTDIEHRLGRSAAEAKRALGRVRVFVSYARADDGLRAELAKHLTALKRQGVAEVWDDRQLGPGDDWSGAIDTRLDEAEIVLLLVSADFMASRWCRLETERALKRLEKGETTVIPVILRPVDWHASDLGRFQALPRDGRPVTDWPSRDAALLDVAAGLRQTVERLLRSPSPEESAAAVAAGELVIAAPEPPLRILHLSDLHVGANTDPVEIYQPLAQDIRDPEGELGFSKLDYLVLSGDLTQRGHPHELERAHRFLDLLFESFGLSPERCLMVPGNHDLSWEADCYEWRQARKVDEDALPAGHWVKQGDGYLVRDTARYGRRFENFARFYKERMQRDYPLEPQDQGVAVLSERDRIQIIGLNSAWEIDEWFPERSSIHPGAVARALSEAERQVTSALADGRMKDARDLLRIAVWHHPATGSGKILEDAFVERLRKARVHLCLHGHVHEDRADLVRWTDPRRLYVAGAGSFGAVAGDRPESTPRLYNLLEIPPDRSLIRVHTRCKRRDGGAWEGWAAWPGEGKGERRTYYEIPLGRESTQ